MNREEKIQIINDLTAKLKENNVFYITDAAGLSVADVNNLRRACFNQGVEYKLYKNTFIQKALENLGADVSEFTNGAVFAGQSGIMFASEETASVPAKVIKEFRKTNEKPILKGASIDFDLFVGDNNVDTLSKLKSKAELIGEVIGLLQSPAKNVISALQSGGDNLAGIIKTLSER
ncbi:50S ribosomal protein L10 [Persicobacter psychrovividus]|uniref:Large ribosomal subunit protein uL10 n=1 Tax=Persicobacter psychrovividus TaxID=387638 RepID=A0ABM7VGJ7_9BACT|nr:50S ribosomal protein L10 [Persicobacter psychrovividus]